MIHIKSQIDLSILFIRTNLSCGLCISHACIMLAYIFMLFVQCVEIIIHIEYHIS